MKTVRTAISPSFCAVLVLVGCQPAEKPNAGGGRKPTPVEAVVVSTGTISRDIVAASTVAGIQEAYVVSLSQGTIERVNFSLGQYVKKGAVLVSLENSVQKAAYENALRTAEMSDIALKSMQALYDSGNASEMELKKAQSDATGAQAGLKNQKRMYDDTRITAPISGYVAQKEAMVEKGNALQGGTLVARIVNLAKLKTTIDVGEMEVGALSVGLPATVRIPAAENHEFEGTVAAIAAGANPASGSYPVEIHFPNTRDRRVKSGMSARVTIQTQAPKDVLLIPALAVTEFDSKDAVLASSNGLAAVRFVELGRSVGNLVEVAHGLSEGDTILTSGMTTLARGDSVAVTVTGLSGGEG